MAANNRKNRPAPRTKAIVTVKLDPALDTRLRDHVRLIDSDISKFLRSALREKLARTSS